LLSFLKSYTRLLKHLHLKKIALFSVLSVAVVECNQAVNVQPPNNALFERLENLSECPEQPQESLYAKAIENPLNKAPKSSTKNTFSLEN